MWDLQGKYLPLVFGGGHSSFMCLRNNLRKSKK